MKTEHRNLGILLVNGTVGSYNSLQVHPDRMHISDLMFYIVPVRTSIRIQSGIVIIHSIEGSVHILSCVLCCFNEKMHYIRYQPHARDRILTSKLVLAGTETHTKLHSMKCIYEQIYTQF